MFMLLYAQHKSLSQSALMKMNHRPEPIRNYLASGGSLAELQQQRLQLQRLCELIRASLPTTLARHLLTCSINGSLLTLYAESAGRATPLRLTTQKLLQKLHQDHGLKQIKAIRVRIADMPAQRLPSNPQPRNLSSETASLLADLAETSIDPEIKKILRRLSGRGRIKKPLNQ